MVAVVALALTAAKTLASATTIKWHKRQHREPHKRVRAWLKENQIMNRGVIPLTITSSPNRPPRPGYRVSDDSASQQFLAPSPCKQWSRHDTHGCTHTPTVNTFVYTLAHRALLESTPPKPPS